MPTYLLAHDLGTTGDKATLFDSGGKIVASTFAPYPLFYPKPGWAEQNAQDWWNAVCQSTRLLLDQVSHAKENLAGVSFSAMMNGCLLIDSEGNPLRPALIHADIRSDAQSTRIVQEIGEERAYQITGNRISAPYFTISKLTWLTEHEPETLEKAQWCVQTKDYIGGKLTGNFGITDYSDASLYGCFDMERRVWSEEIIASAGFASRLLPQVLPAQTCIGRVTADSAQQTGLPEGLPVILGGGDGACATVGAGAIHAGDAYHYLGGTSWVAAVTPQYRPDPSRRISVFCALQPDHYVLYGTVQSAGSSIDWLRSLFGEVDFETLEVWATAAPAGSQGLFFLPYLAGERSPIWDSQARGVYFGLSTAHGRAEMARATFEGVAYALASNLAVLQELGLAPDTVRVLGGGMRSGLWRSILAGVYGRPLLLLEHLSEATSCGAAMNLAVGLGIYPDYAEAAPHFAPIGRREDPDPALQRLYSEGLTLFNSLYPALENRFSALAQWQSEEC